MVNKNFSSGYVFMKRSTKPYLFQIFVMVIVNFLCFYVAIVRREAKLYFAPVFGWGLILVSFRFGFKYRIYWNASEVGQKASGGDDVLIRFRDIVKIQREKSSPAEMAAMSRPYQRIVLYDNLGARIDVSLRHFLRKDILALLQLIRDKRPDLNIAFEKLVAR